MDILDAINEIEERFPVTKWKVDDVDIWPWVRIGVAEENAAVNNIHLDNAGNTFVKRVLSPLKILLSSVYTSIIDYNHSEKIHPADVIFFSSNVTRTVCFPSNQYACQNVDAIKMLLGKLNYSSYTMENLELLPVKYPRYTRSDLMIVWKLFLLRLKNKIMKHEISVFLPDYDEVKTYLMGNGIKCTCLNRDLISHTGNSISVLTDFFYQVLVKTGAKTGLVVCWYTYMQMAFLKACRMAGIPGIDIQHGLAGGNGSAAYIKWSHIPEKGFNTMPTHFWCWTENDKESVNRWLYNSKSDNYAFVGGNPLELLCSLGEIRKEWLERLAVVTDCNKNRVLLSLQTGFALPDWVIECISKTEDKVQWFIRCHPAFDTVQEKFLNVAKQYSNVEVDVATSCPLPILFDVIQFHVTSHSAVVNDATRHGIKSAVVSKTGVNYFKQQILNENIYYASDSIALMELIDKCCIRDKCSKITHTADGVGEIIKLIVGT